MNDGDWYLEFCLNDKMFFLIDDKDKPLMPRREFHYKYVNMASVFFINYIHIIYSLNIATNHSLTEINVKFMEPLGAKAKILSDEDFMVDELSLAWRIKFINRDPT